MLSAAEPVVGVVTRMSLVDALALGPEVWDGVLARTEASSPFMSWAWHRAWADAVPAADRDAAQALLLSAADGNLQAVLPALPRRVTSRRAPVNPLTRAIVDSTAPHPLAR